MQNGIKQLTLKKDEMLIFESDVNNKSLYLVKEGTLEVTKIKPSGRVVLGHVHPGELVGEMALIDEAPRSATVKALTDCVVIEIPKEHLDNILAKQPPWLKLLLQNLVKRLRNTSLKVK
jgi:CRP-like cAMP-binding protein